MESLSCFRKWPKDKKKNASWANKTMSTTSGLRQQVEESTWFQPQFICPLPWDTYLLLTTVKGKVWFWRALVHPARWSLVWSVSDPSLATHQTGGNGLDFLMLPSVFTGQLPRQVRTYFHQALKVGFITSIFLSNFVNKTVQEDVVTNAKLFIQAADEVRSF